MLVSHGAVYTSLIHFSYVMFIPICDISPQDCVNKTISSHPHVMSALVAVFIYVSKIIYLYLYMMSASGAVYTFFIHFSKIISSTWPRGLGFISFINQYSLSLIEAISSRPRILSSMSTLLPRPVFID